MSKGDDGVDGGPPPGRIDARDEADQEREADSAQEDPEREGEVVDVGHPLPGHVEIDDPGDDQADRPAPDAACRPPEKADRPGFEEEDPPDVPVPRPDGLHDPDLPEALEDGHDHGVDDAEGGEDEGV